MSEQDNRHRSTGFAPSPLPLTYETQAELNAVGKIIPEYVASASSMSVLDRLTVTVTFDPAKGYVATIPHVAAPVTALSLNGLRRRIETLLLPDDVVVLLSLDRAARMERDRRRAITAPSAGRVQST